MPPNHVLALTLALGLVPSREQPPAPHAIYIETSFSHRYTIYL
jgi:hypothetical protein